MTNSNPTELSELTEIEVLALISSASVKRDEKRFKKLVTFYISNDMNQVYLYEAVLQTYLFAGYPSALVSLKTLNLLYGKLKLPPIDKRSGIKIKTDGIKNCRRIYGSSYTKLVSNIKNLSPELSHWFIEEGYGKVLSRNSLSLKKRELLICSVLATLKFSDQLFSHLRGSHRLGNDISLIEKTFTNLKLIGQERSAEFGMIQLQKLKEKKLR